MYGDNFGGRSAKRLGRETIDSKYLKSGMWKCSRSPSGVHYWREIKDSKPKGLFYCIYCRDVKWFPATLEQVLQRYKATEPKEPIGV